MSFRSEAVAAEAAGTQFISGVIPAKAGISVGGVREGNRMSGRASPGYAHCLLLSALQTEIPAFAGMTPWLQHAKCL
jgi:hypothetical protein